MIVSYIDLEVLTETDIISYAIEPYTERDFNMCVTIRKLNYRPLTERTLSTSYRSSAGTLGTGRRQTDKKILRQFISAQFFGDKYHETQTHDDFRKRRPLPNESNERMRYTLPRRKLMEHRTGGDPDELPPVLISPLVCDFVTKGVKVLFLDGRGVVKLIDIVGDGLWASGGRHSDLTFFTRKDKVAEVSPVFTVKTVFQPLIKI